MDNEGVNRTKVPKREGYSYVPGGIELGNGRERKKVHKNRTNDTSDPGKEQGAGVQICLALGGESQKES